MAAAFESISTTTWQTVTSGNSLTITKPTGLAEGDYLIAHLSNVVGGSANADGWNTPAGWTSVAGGDSSTNVNSSARMDVFYKLADASDVAASDFSFVKNGSNGTTVIGSLYRISGGGIVTGATATATDTTTPTFANTLTPYANSVLLFLTTVADASDTVGSVSAYAITTSNPTWTERADVVGDISGHRGLHAGATATRPEATATGDSTCTYVNFSQNSLGAIVAIAPVLSVTVPVTVVTATFSVQAPAVTGGATVSPTVVTMTIAVQSPTVSTPTPDWTNASKNSASPSSNTTKNSATFTNTSKNSGSWTNTSKS